MPTVSRRMPSSSHLLFMALAAVLGSGMSGGAGAVQAQQLILDGRVVDADGEGIPGAVVELGRVQAILTDDEGAFRFENVEMGRYQLRIRAFGYGDEDVLLDLRADRTVTVVLEETAFELDSLVVGAEKVEVRGRVRDPVRDRYLPAVEIRTSQGHAVLTDASGAFEVEAWENVPLRVVVLAFGYFAADTLVVPLDGGDPFVLELTEDPVVQAMLGAANRRLEARARGRVSLTMPPLDREQISLWGGNTLDEVLRVEYPAQRRRIACVLLDERPLTPFEAEGFLETTPAWEVERMEFLFSGAMLRIYTREFIKKLLAGGTNLSAPVYVASASPPFCA